MQNLTQSTPKSPVAQSNKKKRNSTKPPANDQPKHRKIAPNALTRKSNRPLPTNIKPTPKRSVKKKKQRQSYCSRLGCHVTNLSHPLTKFHHIPTEPKPLSPNAKRAQYIGREGKVILRQEVLDRYHFKRNIKGGRYKCCEEHEF